MTQKQRRCRGLIAFALATLPLAAPAPAELGRPGETVQADQLRLHASLRRVALASHVRHELTLPNGAVVHEFTNPQGQVFAIRWAGPGKPDLRSLLGEHFGAFQAGNIRPTGHPGSSFNRPKTINNGDFKVAAGGHMGYFWGLAWLPALLPPGVSPGDLQ